MEKGKLIKLDADLKKQIAKEFNVSYQTVCSALNFETQSAKAMTLRAAAINRGGKLYVEEESKKPIFK